MQFSTFNTDSDVLSTVIQANLSSLLSWMSVEAYGDNPVGYAVFASLHKYCSTGHKGYASN